MSSAAEIRSRMFACMRALSAAERKAHAAKLLDQVKKYFESLPPEYWQHRNLTVAFYRSMGSEIPFDPVLEWLEPFFNLRNRVRFCFPVALADHPLRFFSVMSPMLDDQHWRTSAFGFYEPKSAVEVQASEIDLFFVPGVAFSREGDRLGRGKGHYDRTLALARRGAEKIGIAYDFQVVESLAAQPWDEKMDRVLTS